MKKKLLVICYRPPILGHSQNAQGQYYILQSTQKRFETRIMSFNASKISDQNEKYFKKNDLTILKLFNLIFLGKSPRLTHFWDKVFYNKYKATVEEFKPDLIYIDHILMMQYPLKFSLDSRIWLYNEESQLYINKYKLRKSIFDLVKNFRLGDYEKKAISKADKTFLITNQESEYLQSLGFNSVKTIPYALDDSYFTYGWQTKQNMFTLLFVGDYSHQPNQEAARIICKKIYPAIKNLKIKIILVGRNISKIKKYINAEIAVYENVNDVRTFYWTSTLFIAPITSGAGMRIKILEAASCGIPIVMTPLANLGVNLNDSKEAFIESNIYGMIERIKNIFNSDRSDLIKLSVNANKKVNSLFGLDKMKKVYDNLFSVLL